LYENGFPVRNQDLRGATRTRAVYDAVMAEHDAQRDVHSEARGPHWVAWIPDAAGKPKGSVVLVGGTRQEAEERARRWAATNAG
jgi:hypothetical protein